MAKNNNLTDLLKDVADAIRAKKSSSNLINPQDFSNEILTIPTGGETSLPSAGVNDVTFYDYNGHILYSYSRTDFLALTEMPELPSRNGLVCTGWTHNLAEAQEYVSLYRMLNIGACYTTTNGRTQIYFDVYSDANLKRKFAHSIDIAQGVTVYYGDGKSAQNNGTGARTWTKSYPSKGSYVFEFNVADGAVFGLGFESATETRPLFGSDIRSSTVDAYPLGAGLRKIHCGNNITYYHSKLCHYALDLEEISLTAAETLGIYALSNTSIKCCVIPNGMTSIGKQAFDSCQQLKNVILPNTVSSLEGTHLFSKCRSLQSINIPNTVTDIPEACFYEAVSLEVITIPKSVKSIGSSCFYDCKTLMLLNMSQHEEVPTLGNSAFLGANSSVAIVVPDALYDEWIAATNWSAYASMIVKSSEYFTE